MTPRNAALHRLSGDLAKRASRVSVDAEDFGYVRFIHHGGSARKWTILLNGEPVRWCITADWWIGEVICLKQDEHGTIITDGMKAVRESHRGKVQVFVDDNEIS